MAPRLHRPTIRVSNAARKALQEAAVDAGGKSLRFEIDERFDHQFVFGFPAEGDITVEANGLTILLDPASARLADGVSVDCAKRPDGPEFTVTNPRGPRRSKQIELKRDCEATLIPSGEKVRLLQGERVVLTQALGGSYTVQTDVGRLARIAAHDADALGFEFKQASHEPDEGTGSFDLQHVIEQLKTVFDPEIPVNVVDLGLIYVCEAHPLKGGGHRVEIKMSMTAPGCGMGDVLKGDARAKVQAVPGVTEVDVEIVWDPPWDQGRMSEAARLQLGML